MPNYFITFYDETDGRSYIRVEQPIVPDNGSIIIIAETKFVLADKTWIYTGFSSLPAFQFTLKRV